MLASTEDAINSLNITLSISETLVIQFKRQNPLNGIARMNGLRNGC